MLFASSRISVENVTAGPKIPKRFKAPEGQLAKAEPACLAVGHEFVAFILTAIRARVRKRRRKRSETLITPRCLRFNGLQRAPEQSHPCSARHQGVREDKLTRGLSLMLHCPVCFARSAALSIEPGSPTAPTATSIWSANCRSNERRCSKRIPATKKIHSVRFGKVTTCGCTPSFARSLTKREFPTRPFAAKTTFST